MQADLLAQSLREKFLQEAPQAWKAYEQRATKLQGTYEHTAYEATTARYIGSSRTTMKQADGCALLMAAIFDNAPPSQTESFARETADVVNTRYAFSLSRQSPEADWAITGGSIDQKPGASNLFQHAFDGCKAISLLPLRFRQPAGNDIAAAFESGKMTFGDAVPSDLGDGIIAIEFENRWETANDRRIDRGTIHFDRNHLWVMQAYEFQRSIIVTESSGESFDLGTVKGNYTYDYDGEFPILKSLQIEKTNPAIPALQTGAGNLVENAAFDFELGDPPESEFSFEAFGLEAPPDLRAPTRVWLWFGVGAIAAVVIAFFIYWRFRSRQT